MLYTRVSQTVVNIPPATVQWYIGLVRKKSKDKKNSVNAVI
jgi:hypothetical protein